jgi:hypothetical protein
VVLLGFEACGGVAVGVEVDMVAGLGDAVIGAALDGESLASSRPTMTGTLRLRGWAGAVPAGGTAFVAGRGLDGGSTVVAGRGLGGGSTVVAGRVGVLEAAGKVGKVAPVVGK